MDAYFFEKELSSLHNTANDLIALRLLILGAINNILANHRDKNPFCLATVRNLNRLYKQIPAADCATYKFEAIKKQVADEILEFSISKYLPAQRPILKKAS